MRFAKKRNDAPSDRMRGAKRGNDISSGGMHVAKKRNGDPCGGMRVAKRGNASEVRGGGAETFSGTVPRIHLRRFTDPPRRCGSGASASRKSASLLMKAPFREPEELAGGVAPSSAANGSILERRQS